MKKNLLLFIFFIAVPFVYTSAQRAVNGKVTDTADGSPLGGVIVSVKGTSVANVSNADGAYRLTLPSGGKHTLVFSMLGYATREISVDDKSSNVNVQLTSDAVAIENIVVTGFQNVKKETFAGSSVKIAMDEIVGGGMDVSRMLEGKVAGVSIQNVSSTFGSAPKVRIRGVTSINGENKPLWVVDGVVLEDVVNVSNDQLSSGDPTTLLGSSVAGLNNSDIESMDILKDAAATALYGARAMNGVIVITTKRGKEGAPRISYNGNFTIRTKPRYENFDIMNSADQMAVNAELYRKGLLGVEVVNWANWGPYGLMYKKVNVWDPQNGFALINDPEHRKQFLLPYAKANTDWFGMLFTNKLMHEHSLSISSGTERSKTYSSFSFLNDAGATIADKVNRYTFNVRNDYKISKKINTIFQFVGSYRQQKVPGSFSRGSDPVRGTWSRDFDINPFSYSYNTSRAVRAYDDEGNLEFVQMNYAPFNILHELKENWMDINVIDVRGQGEFHYEFIKNLKFSAVGSLRYVNSAQNHVITELSNVAQAYRAADNDIMRDSNPFLWRDIEDAANKKISVLPEGGFYNQRKDEMLHYNVRASLAYNKIWDNGSTTHEMSAFAGTEIKYTDRNTASSTGVGYLHYDGQRFVESADYARMLKERNGQRNTLTYNRIRFRAYFLNADYTFDRRYTLSISGRYDGSNQLGKDRSSRWLPTGTAAAKWNIANESFMAGTKDFIDHMGLRFSFGLTATMPPVANSSAIFYSNPTFAPDYQQNAIDIDALANLGLTWEKSYMFNLGYDLIMFRNRFNVALEYWNRRSFDLIADVKDSGIGGQLYKPANYANLYSWGVDVTLGGTVVSTKDWKLNLNFTLGYSFDEIRNMTSLPQIMSLVSQTGGNKNGHPVNSIFSIPFVGLDPEKGTPLYLGPDGSIVEDAYMQSQNTDYLKYEGPADPRYTGGLTASASWKGLSATVFFSYQLGNVVRLNPSYAENYSDLSALSREFKDRWMASDGWVDNALTPAILDRLKAAESTGAYTYNVYNYSSARVAKGDFIRLKTVSIGYDLPTRWMEKSKIIRTASIRATGKDLWLMWADKRLNGQDPEFLNTGGVALPALPSVIISLSLGF